MSQDQAFILPKGAAMSVLQGIRDGVEPSTEILRPYAVLVNVPGGFRGLHDDLKTLTLRLGSPKSNEARAEFEAEGCVLIHRALRELPDDLLEDAEFWMWLTIFQCRDIVEWRMGADAKFGNFGLEGKLEGLICRMFMRASIVHSESDQDPYSLARIGTQDFWRSFMIRRNYASVKSMARAFARVVNERREGALSDQDVRKLGPKITQLNSTYAYELLDERQCFTFVKREFDRLFPHYGN
jgi:hypothetical protein